jgi:hypothetical protein
MDDIPMTDNIPTADDISRVDNIPTDDVSMMGNTPMMDSFPMTRPRRGRTGRRRIGILAALLVVIALIAGGALLISSRPANSAGPGVAHIGATATTTGQSQARSGSTPTAEAYSACMRSHGVPNFPDPDSQGRIAIKGGQSANGTKFGLDPNSPGFQTARKACQSLQPGGKVTPAQQAQRRSQELKFSACMRAHGVPKYPDPDSTGGMQLRAGPGTGINPSSPQFQAAQKACQSLQPGGSRGESIQDIGSGPIGSGPIGSGK